MTTEIWKDIPGYSGSYEASNLGRIRSVTGYRTYINRFGTTVNMLVQGRVLKTDNKINNSGYKFAGMGSGKHTASVHTLVATTFLGPKPTQKHIVNHKDCNKLNNNVTNLEWVTASENYKHAVCNGLLDAFRIRQSERNTGTLNNSSKHTEADILAIRADKRSDREVAKAYGVSRCNINQIRNRKIWRHI